MAKQSSLDQSNCGKATTTIAVLLAVIVLGAFGIPYVRSYFSLTKQIRQNPQIALVPRPLSEVPELKAHSTTLRHFGLGTDMLFQVPWGEPESTESLGFVTMATFSESRLVCVYDPLIGDLGDAFGSLEIRPFLLAPPKEAKAPTSGYAFLRTRLEWQPKHPGFFPSQEWLESELRTLEYKSSYLPKGTSALYAVTLGDLRGFQIEMSSPRRQIDIYVFDRKEERYSLRFIQTSDKASPVSQAEINYVMHSLVYIPSRKGPPAWLRGLLGGEGAGNRQQYQGLLTRIEKNPCSRVSINPSDSR